MSHTAERAEAEPAVGNDMFLRNMRALWRCDPVLAMRVDAVRDDERLSLEPTRSGLWTVKMDTPDGSSTYLHSRYDPVDEAERLVGAVPIEEKYCFVVSGLGLGYHVRALFDRLRGDAFIVCVEPSIPLIATALTCVDLTKLIESGRFMILTGADKARLHERLADRGTLMMLGAQFVRHAPSARVAEAIHTVITGAIAEFVTYNRMSLLTLVTNAQITCKNIAMNLGTYVSTPPIDLLRNRFAGNPGVVIAAGPSLSRNIDQLSKLKGKAVLCAVQTAIKPLLARGITPDFVTSLDFHEMSQKFFEDAGDLSDVHLVAEPKATWPVIDHFPGPVSLLDSAWARLVLGDHLGGRDGLKAGATVAHLAFYLAAYMGCDPIVFVGQDLAYTGHVFYVPGVEIHRAWRGELNRFHSIEQKEWERIVRNRSILRQVPGVEGGELYTDELLLTYLEQFEKDIAAIPVKVIDATEGGTRIRGTDVMSLSDVMEQFCKKDIDPGRFAYRTSTNWRNGERFPAARDEVNLRIAELDEAVTICDELLRLLPELKKLTHDVGRFNRRLVRVDELRTRVQHESRAYRLVNAACQLADLRRFSADRKIGAVEQNEAERAKQQITRDVEFVTAVRDGAGDVKRMLVEAVERIERRMDQE